MVVLRVRRSVPVLFLALLLAACDGTTESLPPQQISLAGSVGDGPVVGAEIVVTDANGDVVEQRTSDARASYRLTLPAGTPLPARISATGGTDLVTGRPLDFDLVGAALEDGEITVNLTPLSTLAVRAAECSVGGLSVETLDRAWARVFEQLSMGLDRTLVSDPMSQPVDRANVEAVVLANEALGETVRRSVRALAASGSDVDGNAILEQIACDLVGRPATTSGDPLEPRLVAAFRGAELGVRLETLAGRLEVDDAPAMAAMDESIRTIMPEFTDPSVAAVPVTGDGRDQALALLAVFQPSLAGGNLAELIVSLDGAPTDTVMARVDAALTPALQTDLRAFADNLAFADEATLVALSERRDRRDAAPRPTVSLAAEPDNVASGESAQLSWATVNADACVAGGAWSGPRPLEGTASTGRLQRSGVFEVACVGLGGTARSSVLVTVNGMPPEPDPVPDPDPIPEPDPVPEPDPIPDPDPDPVPAPEVSLSATVDSVLTGGTSQLNWTSSNASACTAQGGWSGSRPVNGSASVGPLAQTTTYRLVCTGAGGSASDSVQVSVNAPPPAPTMTLSAASGTVDQGDSTQLSWQSSNASACSASGGWSGTRPADGSAAVGPLTATTTYTLSCSGAGGSVQRSVTVTVREPAPEPSVSLSAAASVVDDGAATQLSWTSSNADSCSASGGWSGARGTSGSASSGALSRQTTFTLNCSGAGGSAMAMISVAVNGDVVLQWQAPTENVDGSPLTDLGGFRIYYGQSSRSYTESVELMVPGTSSHTLTLPSGDYYIAMTAVDSDGNESAYSNEVVKTVD